jgi:predicted transcriptional regulator
MGNHALVQMAVDLVSSHASTHELTKEELLSELQDVFKTLAAMTAGDELITSAEEATTGPTAAGEEAAASLKPAVPLQAAFSTEKVFCMVCGQGMKTLRRHLSKAHGMTPRDYRRAFGISTSTPLVAKAYSDARKAMAKDLNLGDRLAKAREARMEKRKAAGAETQATPAAKAGSKKGTAKKAPGTPKPQKNKGTVTASAQQR